MSDKINLAGEIEKQLPAELVEFLQSAGLTAAGQGLNLYLVGGPVRDLILDRPNLDLDLTVEGDALALSQILAEITGAKLTTHPRFRTATLKWDRWSADIASSRAETYARPGALPTVRPGSLQIDLFRRDFTINAMALSVIPGSWGELTDLYGGQKDLKKGLIRVLHEGSFIDDATRIWRALRYEQRLDFRMEPRTLRLLKRDIPMLETITAERIRHEIELVLNEAEPEKVFRRADKLGVLPELHPSLQGDAWLARKFRAARKAIGNAKPEIYLALLAWRLNETETLRFISGMKLRKAHADILQDCRRIKSRLRELSDPALKPSRIYRLLQGRRNEALVAAALAADDRTIVRNIRLFQKKRRYAKTALNGRDLQNMGVPSGPRLKEILSRLRDARLDGEIRTHRGEVELARRIAGE